MRQLSLVLTPLNKTANSELNRSATFQNFLPYFIKVYIRALPLSTLEVVGSAGYSRAYLNFLINLRNRSVYLNTNLINEQALNGIGADVLMPTKVSVANFGGFYNFLLTLKKLIRRKILNKNLLRGNVFFSIKNKIIGALSDLFFQRRGLSISNSELFQNFAEEFTMTLLNILRCRKTPRQVGFRALKRGVFALTTILAQLGNPDESVFYSKFLLQFFF